MRNKYLLSVSILIYTSTLLRAQYPMGSSGVFQTNFDALLNTGLTNTWADNNTIPHIFSQRTTASVLYAASTGSSTAGGLYSFGTIGSTERALGSIGSANTSFGGNFAHGALLQNTSGADITVMNVSYVLEQWRNGGNTTPNTITFWYKISPAIINDLTPASNTGWTSVTALDAASPINTATAGAINGNNAPNRLVFSDIDIPSLLIPNGSYIMLRWFDPDHTGSDHGLAIDDLRVTFCNTPQTFYADADNDGYGDPSLSVQACIAPPGYVSDNTDCNDNNASIYVPVLWYADTDNDGFGDVTVSQTSCFQPNGYVLDSSDCDDSNGSVNSFTIWFADTDNDGYGDVSNFLSNCGQPIGYVSDSTDCNDADSLVHVSAWWYNDQDNDGFGSLTDSVLSCNQPIGYISITGDCNDTLSFFYPNATEVFDGLDNNCNGFVDEGFVVYYLDNDGDLYGGTDSVIATSSPGVNYVLISGDCVDTNATVYPGAPELCDGLDNNCNGSNDEGLTFAIYYADIDNDGFGNAFVTINSCLQPFGYVSDSTDCNDNDNTIGQGNKWFPDLDGDGFGDAAIYIISCNQPIGFVSDSSDCNDNSNTINPNTIWYADADGDNYGDSTNYQLSCTQPSGFISDRTDCNDSNAGINPGAFDIPDNSIDENCDGFDNITIGINVIEEKKITIYPNPGSEFANIYFDKSWGEYTQLFLYSIDGQLINQFNYTVSNKGFIVDTGKLAKGVYFFKLQNNNNQVLARWVKQ